MFRGKLWRRRLCEEMAGGSIMQVPLFREYTWMLSRFPSNHSCVLLLLLPEHLVAALDPPLAHIGLPHKENLIPMLLSLV